MVVMDVACNHMKRSVFTTLLETRKNFAELSLKVEETKLANKEDVELHTTSKAAEPAAAVAAASRLPSLFTWVCLKL